MLHELGEVEEGLGDLWDVLGGESLLQTVDQLVLLSLTQLSPTRHKRCIKQIPGTAQSALITWKVHGQCNSTVNINNIEGPRPVSNDRLVT